MRLSPIPPVAIDLPPALPRSRVSMRLRMRQMRRRIGVLLLVSALLHVALLVTLLLSNRPPEQGAVSPPSFEMVMKPGSPIGKAGESKPSQIPTPALPPAVTAPPAPTASQPPPTMRPPIVAPAPPPPLAALQPAVPPPPAPVPLPAAKLPLPAAKLPPPIPQATLPQSNQPQANEPVRLSLAEPPRVKLPPSPPFTMPQPPPDLPHAAAPRRAEPAFPAPMDISLGRPLSPPAHTTMRGTGAMDLTIGKAAREFTGAPPRDDNAAEGMIHVRGGKVGKDWLELLHEWWEQHSEYPQQAALRGEDGTVQIHLKVDPYGRVALVEVESPSGSQWLDMGAMATFRGQQLPAFTRPSPEGADLDITIDYILVGKGRR